MNLAKLYTQSHASGKSTRKAKMRILLIISTSLFLASCGNDTPPVHDVKYYLDNPDILENVLESCSNDPGNLANTPNCVNAEEAFIKRMDESRRRVKGAIK